MKLIFSCFIILKIENKTRNKDLVCKTSFQVASGLRTGKILVVALFSKNLQILMFVKFYIDFIIIYCCNMKPYNTMG